MRMSAAKCSSYSLAFLSVNEGEEAQRVFQILKANGPVSRFALYYIIIIVVVVVVVVVGGGVYYYYYFHLSFFII